MPVSRSRRRSWSTSSAACALVVFTFGSADAASPDPAPRDAAATLYVNFDGAVITGGPDDSRSNVSEVAEQFAFTGSYPAYGGTPAQRQSVMAAVSADWAAFDVQVVDARPGQGDYGMTMIGPLDHPLGMGVNSAGPIDCWDENPNNISFVFFGADDLGGQASTAVQATEVSQEWAHAVGLEHVGGGGAESDIMYPSNFGPSAAFIDECYALAGGVTCADMHAELSGCAEADRQNSFRELLALFGPAQADVESPEVAIRSPADGESFQVGDVVVVEVDATDDVGVDLVGLQLDEEVQPTKAQAPFTWQLVDVAEGEHTLLAVARDVAGNETMSVPITFVVAAGQQNPDSGDEGQGCGCGVGPTEGGSTAWLTLILLGFSRRRTLLRRID